MRDIKFRGKRLDNGEWVYGYYVKSDPPTIEHPDLTSKHTIIVPTVDIYEVDPATVGQYTGLKDKNGQEIYEGDITDEHRLIEWGFTSADGEAFGYAVYDIDEDTEIIGNIHDNPELLIKAE